MGSPLSDARGFRRDVLDAARPLGNRDRDLVTRIDLGAASITGPSGPGRSMGPTWARPTRSSTPARCEFAGRGGRIETVLPAHSVTLLRFEVA